MHGVPRSPPRACAHAAAALDNCTRRDYICAGARSLVPRVTMVGRKGGAPQVRLLVFPACGAQVRTRQRPVVRPSSWYSTATLCAVVAGVQARGLKALRGVRKSCPRFVVHPFLPRFHARMNARTPSTRCTTLNSFAQAAAVVQ